MAIRKSDAELYYNHPVIVPMDNVDGNILCYRCAHNDKEREAKVRLKNPTGVTYGSLDLCGECAEVEDVDAIFEWDEPENPDNNLQTLVWKKEGL